MKLMTAQLRKAIPTIGSQDNDPDPIVYAKYFHPYGSWTWYVTEFDGEDTFFGWVDGDYFEAGTFSLSEMESTRVHGLPMERDLYFKPCRLSEIRPQASA